MAPKKRKVAVSRHLICCNCSSWVHFVSSGCGKTWAVTRGKSFVFTCKGCTEVKVLVKEVEELKQMVEEMTEKVTGLRLEDKGEETDSRVAKTGANQESEEAAGNVRTEEMITGVEDEGEIRTEERKAIYAGTPLNMATHAYTKNQESPVGKEIDLRQWDTLIFKGEHAENEHWRLVEDRNGQVGYAPAAFLMVILDTTAEEQERYATEKGQWNSTEDDRIGGRIGEEGERRKSYSAAVIDGIKRTTTIYVGDSIIRKSDARLCKGDDVVVCLPGARIEHVTERVEKIMGRRNGGTILVHVGTNNTDKGGTTAIVEKYRKLLKKTKQAGLGQIIYQEYYQCVETGSRDTGTRRGWQSTGWWSGFERKRMWDMWTCGTALWGMKNCTLEMAYSLVESGLPFLPRDCQGRLPVAWVKYDI